MIAVRLGSNIFDFKYVSDDPVYPPPVRNVGSI